MFNDLSKDIVENIKLFFFDFHSVRLSSFLCRTFPAIVVFVVRIVEFVMNTFFIVYSMAFDV